MTPVAVGFPILIALLHGFVLYGSAGRDDSHITYWSAKALVEFGSIANLNGEPLEQSSSLLHVLILSAAYAVTGIAIPTLGTILSIFFGILAILATWHLACRQEMKLPWFAALFLSVFPFLVYWSFGGLETSLVALIVVLIVHGVHVLLVDGISAARITYVLSSIAAYIMVRPEAIFVLFVFFALTALGFLLFERTVDASAREARHRVRYSYFVVVSLSAASVIFFALLSAWRILTFGQIFPQPVYAKASGLHLLKMLQGTWYLFKQFEMLSLVLIAVFVVVLLLRIKASTSTYRRIASHIVVSAFTFAYLAFVITAGGDYMEGGRFLVPLLPLIVILGFSALDDLSDRVRACVLFTVVALAAVDTSNFVRSKSTGTPTFAEPLHRPVFKDFGIAPDAYSWFEYTNRVHLRDLPVAEIMKRIVGNLIATQDKDIVIFSGQMGLIPYYLASENIGKIKFIDRQGITTRYLTDCRAAAEVARTQGGIALSYMKFFERFEDWQTECELERPDVIFDLIVPNRMQTVLENGYRIIYSQVGRISHQLEGGLVDAGQFVAVREDLLPHVSRNWPLVYRWPSFARTVARLQR